MGAVWRRGQCVREREKGGGGSEWKLAGGEVSGGAEGTSRLVLMREVHRWWLGGEGWPERCSPVLMADDGGGATPAKSSGAGLARKSSL